MPWRVTGKAGGAYVAAVEGWTVFGRKNAEKKKEEGRRQVATEKIYQSNDHFRLLTARACAPTLPERYALSSLPGRVLPVWTRKLYDAYPQRNSFATDNSPSFQLRRRFLYAFG